MEFSRAFAAAFGRPGESFILPMLACRALFDGAAAVFGGGVLRVDGKVLIGLSGKPYAFQSADTAARWCASGRRVIEAELALVERLGETARAAWLEKKQANLAKRAESLLSRAVGQNDAAVRAALVAESAWCQAKWGAY